MRKLASTFPNMLLSLTLVTAASGALLGWIYDVTKDPIAAQAAEAQLAAIRDVAPAFDNNPEADADTVMVQGKTCVVYPAMKNGKLVGAAVKAVTMDGFAGEIVVMCGFEKDGTLKDYRVLSHAETPGLGAKMEAWFRDPAAARSVIGKNPAKVKFTVSKDGGDIDGITAATISSRAFLGAVRAAYDAYCEKNGIEASAKADGSSGASKQHEEASATPSDYGPEDARAVRPYVPEDAHSGASTRHHEAAPAKEEEHVQEADAASGASVHSSDVSDKSDRSDSSDTSKT